MSAMHVSQGLKFLSRNRRIIKKKHILDSHEMGRDVNKMEGHWFEIVMTLMVVGQVVWVWYAINNE